MRIFPSKFYRGKNEQGVPQFQFPGKTDCPPLWHIAISAAILIFVWFPQATTCQCERGIPSAFEPYLTRSLWDDYLTKMQYIAYLLFGCLALLDTYRIVRFRWRKRRLFTPDTALDKTGFEEIIKGSGVKPNCNINGRDYYDLKDFADARATLLRASSAPAASVDTLLRPAAYADTTPPDQLLHPITTDNGDRQ